MKDSLSKRIYGIGTIKRITKKVNLLGIKLDPQVFIGFRFVTSFLLFIALFLIFDFGYIIAPIVTVFYYFLVETVLLDFNINRRAKEMENAAISYFPVFLISLRCSRSVKKSLAVTNKIVKNKLSYEFDKVLNDVTVGKSLQESLEMCIERMPSEIIVNILVSLIEADRLGNNIDKTVSIQLDYLKEVNKKKLLHNYSLISIKLVFVFCFFMLIFLCALIVITYILSMI
ncbi:MAG: type II secretion system F family protein [Candidatus Coprovivens sp.]